MTVPRSDLPTRLLAAIDEREQSTRREWPVTGTPATYTQPNHTLAVCAAHRSIVIRYTDAVVEADRLQRIPYAAGRSEARVGVLADVLGDLATAYGVTR